MKKDGFSTLLNVFYYYYFVLAILNLIFLGLNLDFLFNITTWLIIISMIIEFICGYIRGCLGIFGYLISIGIFILITNDIWVGISIGLSVAHIIYIFINYIFIKLLYFLDKLLKKK